MQGKCQFSDISRPDNRRKYFTVTCNKYENHMNLLQGFVFHILFQIHANCRIRRVYFSDRLYSEDELPAEFKLYLPVQNKGGPMPAK